MSSLMNEARSRVPRIAEAAVERARLTVVPRTTGRRAARVPFVTLVSLILVAGVAGLLFFNTSMQQVSFTATRMEHRAQLLDAKQQGLQMQLDSLRNPQRLALRAKALGMVPAGQPGVHQDQRRQRARHPDARVVGRRDPRQLRADPSPQGPAAEAEAGDREGPPVRRPAPDRKTTGSERRRHQRIHDEPDERRRGTRRHALAAGRKKTPQPASRGVFVDQRQPPVAGQPSAAASPAARRCEPTRAAALAQPTRARACAAPRWCDCASGSC